jgi:hypothetical protein
MPWAQILDALIGLIDLVRSRRIKAMSQGRAPAGALDSRVSGLVSSTMRDEFERERLRILREREEAEEAARQRAELARKVDLLRQAGDREIGRLRLLTGVAVAGWLGTLLLGTLHGHVMGAGLGPKVLLGVGWLLLLAAIAASFAAQSSVTNALESIARQESRALRRGVSSGIAGALTIWLIVCGLAFAGLGVLFS